MRLALLLFPAALFAQSVAFPGPGMPASSGVVITKVTGQECGATTNAASNLTCTFPGALTSGNAVLYFFSTTVSTSTFSSISCVGGGSATATAVRGPGTGARNAWIYLVTGCTGTGVNVALGGTVGRLNVAGEEFNKTSGSWSIDAGSCTTNSDCTNNGTGTTSSTASFTPSAGIPEVIGSITSNGSNASGTSAGWTDGTSPNPSMAFAWRIETSTAGAYSRNWTIAVSATWNTTIGGIK